MEVAKILMPYSCTISHIYHSLMDAELTKNHMTQLQKQRKVWQIKEHVMKKESILNIQN